MPGEPLGKAVAAVMRTLANDDVLPGEGDIEIKLPPVGLTAWLRAVPRTGWSLLYQGAEKLRFQHPAVLSEGLSQTLPRRGGPSTSLPPKDASAEKLRFSAACYTFTDTRVIVRNAQPTPRD